MLELTLRLIFSLAVVIGLLLLALRFTGKRLSGGPDALVQVVHRLPLGRTSSLTVVTIGSRVLVLGATEQNVTLLTELDPEEIVSPEAVEAALADGTAPKTSGPTLQVARTTSGPLSGSLLSPTTWKQTWEAIQPKGRHQ